MSDTKTCYTIAELAEITSSKVVGDPNYQISGIDNLECATGCDASFLANPLYSKALKVSNAGVVFINQPLTGIPCNQLIHPNPSEAFQQIIELFNNSTLAESGFKGIHPTAVIHPSATISPNVSIGPHAVIDQNVVIGENTTIYAQVSIGANVEIGNNCIIHPQATVRENCIIGNFVILQPSAVIGSCGFGYSTNSKGQHKKLKHFGKVILEDHVEVGACSCIDRARFKETRIKTGVKIDNLVQIAHGVQVGESSLIIAQVGIAGSSIIGKHNILAGQAGVVGHLKLTDHVRVAAKGAVTKNLTEPGMYGGIPAIPKDKFYRQQMHFRRIDQYAKRIKKLEAKLQQLETSIQKSSSI